MNGCCVHSEHTIGAGWEVILKPNTSRAGITLQARGYDVEIFVSSDERPAPSEASLGFLLQEDGRPFQLKNGPKDKIMYARCANKEGQAILQVLEDIF